MNKSFLSALAAAKGLRPSPKELDRVAESFGDEAARWAFTQWELREKARSRFERAEEMFFTREALEQASHPAIARYRASKFTAGQWVADLTCSIGSDLIALAEPGPTLGIDIDEERLEYAKSNLAAYGLSAHLSKKDCLSFAWETNLAVADPSRRLDGKRVTKISEYSPDPTLLAERMRELWLGCIKLSPMLSDKELEDFGGQLEFFSYGGECREAAVWLGRRVEPSRCAVHIESGEVLESNDYCAEREPSAFLFEADPATIRAHCLGSLCAEYGLTKLGDSNGYLTGQNNVSSVWMTVYRILDECKADDKTLRSKLRELDATIDAVKSRAKGIEPEKVRQKLQNDGNRSVILVAYPVGKGHRWLIVEKL